MSKLTTYRADETVIIATVIPARSVVSITKRSTYEEETKEIGYFKFQEGSLVFVLTDENIKIMRESLAPQVVELQSVADDVLTRMHSHDLTT